MNPSMLISGLCSVTFRSLDPEEIVALAAEAGLEAIEWGGDKHVPHGDDLAAARVRELTRSAGLRVSSYGSYYRAGEHASPPFADVLRSAEILGAPIIRVWAGGHGSDQVTPKYADTVIRDLRHCAELAASKGIGLGLEFHGGTLTDSNEAALSLLNDIPEANVSIYWQPKPEFPHEYRLAGLRQLLPRLGNVHVFQWRADHSRLALEAGETEWPVYLETAATAPGGDRFALLEFVEGDLPQALRHDAATLRHWLGH